MPKQVTVKINSAGLDTGPFTVSNDAGETLATGVSKISLFTGLTYTMADAASIVYLTSSGTCTNTTSKNIIQVVPTPTPTATPTSTPTATPTVTPTGSSTPAPVTLTLGYLRVANKFTASLNQAIGVDISILSIYADGYNNDQCTGAMASAFDVRNILALPASNTNYSWSPQSVCGGSGTSCWTTATKYTVYNVNVNGNTVSNGQTINIGGVDVIVSFPPCRQLF